MIMMMMNVENQWHPMFMTFSDHELLGYSVFFSFSQECRLKMGAG